MDSILIYSILELAKFFLEMLSLQILIKLIVECFPSFVTFQLRIASSDCTDSVKPTPFRRPPRKPPHKKE
jgi:hypothetical protein